MKISSWLRRVVTLTIASFSFWNTAINNNHQMAYAQAGNILVYITGDNPIALNIARQVVTNPVIASVNGQTSIVTGSFDSQTADFVTRELLRRGVSSQQIFQTPQTFQPLNFPATASPYVTLPNYLPSNISANGIENSAQYRFVTAIPMSRGGLDVLAQVQRLIPGAFVAKSFRGDYIYAGGYTNRDEAESLKYFLRSQGLDARVIYF